MGVLTSQIAKLPDRDIYPTALNSSTLQLSGGPVQTLVSSPPPGKLRVVVNGGQTGVLAGTSHAKADGGGDTIGWSTVLLPLGSTGSTLFTPISPEGTLMLGPSETLRVEYLGGGAPVTCWSNWTDINDDGITLVRQQLNGLTPVVLIPSPAPGKIYRAYHPTDSVTSRGIIYFRASSSSNTVRFEIDGKPVFRGTWTSDTGAMRGNFVIKNGQTLQAVMEAPLPPGNPYAVFAYKEFDEIV